MFKEHIKMFIPDSVYVRYLYKRDMRRKLNLRYPKSFNEKLQWLKIYDRKKIYTTMVDKYEAKKYVEKKIGKDYIVPTYGVWYKFNDIEFEKLPDKFVLKCTHDSGGIVLVKEKKTLDIKYAERKINLCLKRNFFYIGREWPYKNIVPRVLAEKYLECKNGDSMIDYKFYCFNGEPKFLYISKDFTNHNKTRVTFLSLDWKKMPFKRVDYKELEIIPPKPSHFNEMVDIAKKLSFGMNFLRVDLYEIDGKVYFSEMTFYPCDGFMKFDPPEYDLIIGKMLDISK